MYHIYTYMCKHMWAKSSGARSNGYSLMQASHPKRTCFQFQLLGSRVEG